MVTPQRRIEYMPLEEIKPAKRNPKEHAGQAIGSSINRFGFAEAPLLDERTGRLVAGHGRLQQLLEMHAAGDTPPAGIVSDAQGRWTIPIQRGWASRTDAEAEAYLVAANRLEELGGWDDPLLAEVLEDLADQHLLDVTGYDQQGLQDLVSILSAPPDEPPGGRPAIGGGSDRDEDFDQDSPFLPVISVRVDSDTFDRWRAALDYHEGKNDTTKLLGLLTEIESHRDGCV